MEIGTESSVLAVLRGATGRLRLADIVSSSGLAQTTAYAAVLTLERSGVVRWHRGPRRRLNRGIELVTTRPAIEEPAAVVNETGTIAQRVARFGGLQSLAAKFWNNVERDGDCLVWRGRRDQRGYGVMYLGRDDRDQQMVCRPHSFAWELLRGPVPAGQCLDHLCRNRACVNVEHLEAVDPGTNVLRGIGSSAQNARKTHCKHGHALPPHQRGKRRKCKPCEAAWMRAKRARQRA